MPTITIEGQEHEVSLEDIQLEEGHKVVTDEELNKQYISRSLVEGDDAVYVDRKQLERRYKNWVPKDKAVEDEGIVSDVLKKHGEAFKSENLEDAKAQWDQAVAEPLRKENEDLKGSLGSFEQQVVGSEIDAVSKDVWRNDFATAPEGRKSWSRVNFENEFAYDHDHGYVVAVSAKGDPMPSTNPTQRRPYMGVRERLTQLAEQDEWSQYAKPAERITTGDGAGEKGGDGKVTKRRSDMTVKEKSKYVAEHGKDAYLQLPA